MHTIDCECTYSAMQLQRNLSKKLENMNVANVEETNVQPRQNGIKRKFCIALREDGGTDVSTLLQKQRKVIYFPLYVLDKKRISRCQCLKVFFVIKKGFDKVE